MKNCPLPIDSSAIHCYSTLMEHKETPMTLSPDAQAVLDAAVLPCTIREGIAASLRALADQSETLYDPHEGKVSVIRTDRVLAIASELNRNVGEDFKTLFELIDQERFDDARNAISNLEKKLGEVEPELIRASTLIRFLEGANG